MPYTDDPANVPADKVRFLVNDTSTTSPDLSDNEVAYLLADEGDDPVRAAARAAEVLSAKSAKSADQKQVGPLMLRSYNDKAKKYADLARRLWARASSTGATPFAGGISASDKETRELEADRVDPYFDRDMMTYPGGCGYDDSEELLGES